ncbi:unannotated protein [freshwater metagenome]|jgi:hypothetical protein|uniref:Unannotated protein n=1 Tax=freshwater metagenome TaxID=449393 RepID=A0A6J7DCP5_9ZZZZ|nr:membrane protein insertion efficiency factor YidD [Actinomycetota bacterium]
MSLIRIITAPISFYQRFISPAFPATCRYYPSCSAYAIKAIEVHGPFIGLYLGVRRLLRCHPFTPGGIDQVPPAGQWASVKAPFDPEDLLANRQEQTRSDALSPEATSLSREHRIDDSANLREPEL